MHLSHVTSYANFVTKATVAELAGDGQLARVPEDVHPQRGAPREALAAVRAAEGLLSRVPQEVPRQVCPGHELGGALRTLVRALPGVRAAVGVQSAAVREDAPAHVAGVPGGARPRGRLLRPGRDVQQRVAAGLHAPRRRPALGLKVGGLFLDGVVEIVPGRVVWKRTERPRLAGARPTHTKDNTRKTILAVVQTKRVCRKIGSGWVINAQKRIFLVFSQNKLLMMVLGMQKNENLITAQFH